MNQSVSQQASLQAHGGRFSAYSLKDVGLAAWKERGAIAGCVLAGLAGAAGYVALSPTVYEAKAQLESARHAKNNTLEEWVYTTDARALVGWMRSAEFTDASTKAKCDESGAGAGSVLAYSVVQGTPYVEITSRSTVAEKADLCLEAAVVRVKASQIANMNKVDSKHVHILTMFEDGIAKRAQEIQQLRSVAGGTMIYVDSTSANLVLLEKIENIKAYLATKEQRTNLFNRVPAVQRIYPDQHRSIVAGALSGLLLATA